MELPLSPALLLVTLATVILLNTKRFWRAFFGPLAKVPGPWHASLSNLRLKAAVLSGKRPHYIHSLHQRYGPIVRVSPDEISTCDPDAYRTIFNVRSGFTKTEWYLEVTGKDYPGVFTMSEAKDHAVRRKLLSRGFQKGNLRRDWEPTVLRCAKLAVKGMQNESRQHGEADILKWWGFLATDVSGSVMFGESFRMLETGQKSKFMTVVESNMMGSGMAVELPFLRTVGPYAPFRGLRELFGGKDYIRNYAKRAVANAKDLSGSSSRNVFATIIAESDKDSALVTDEMIVAEASNLIIAGSDTTGNTLCYLTYSVARNSELRAALEAEVSALAEGDVRDEVLERLPLLNAVIMETLRLYGAAPGSLPRVVPVGGATLCGYEIPPDTIVSSQAWSLARLKDVWGPDADEFNHTRWMGKEPVSERMMACWRPWGGDPRACLGLHLAWMEMRIAVAVFFRENRGVRVSPSTTPGDMEIENYFLSRPRSHRCMIRL